MKGINLDFISEMKVLTEMKGKSDEIVKKLRGRKCIN